jgi:DNA transposition AAA+ family ATPase
MAPEFFTTLEANRLRELARKMEEHRESAKLSKEGLIKQFPTLGSSKTFQRILDGDLAELDLERQLVNYQSAVALLEDMARDVAQADEEIISDMSPATKLRKAVLDTMRETGNARVIFLLGPSGSGKSSARRALFDRYGGRFLLIEANAAWNDSPNAMLGEILRKLGVKDLPANPGDRLNKVVEMLAERRRGVVIEEAHHLGPRSLNVVKTLVNQTPGEFILIAVDTIWRKLETAAFEECRQLTGNRLAERIQLDKECKPSDVAKMIKARVPAAESFADDWTKRIAHHAPNYGRFAFVRDVLKRAAEFSGELVKESIVTFIQEEIASR